jgi:hypothetical protein
MAQSLSQRLVEFDMAGRLRSCCRSRIEGWWTHSPTSASADLRWGRVVLTR